MGLTRAILTALLMGAACSQAAGQGIFTCVDSKGRRITADRPIADCMDREQKELNPSGTVRGKLAPSLTPPERAAEEEKARKAAEEKARANEEKKRQLALVARYPNREAHDKVRSAALEPVDAAIKTAEARSVDLAAQRKKFDVEMDFYRRDPSRYPPVLKRQLDENELNLGAQKRFIANQNEEKKRVNTRFDEELAVLRKLWVPQASK